MLHDEVRRLTKGRVSSQWIYVIIITHLHVQTHNNILSTIQIGILCD